MFRYIVAILTLSLCVLPTIQTQAKSGDSAADKKAGVPTITVTKLDISDKALNLCYVIRNDSADEAWILVGYGHLGELSLNAEIFMAEDGETLTIRRRLHLPTSIMSILGAPFYGRYVCLPPGESQTEWISVETPVHPAPQFAPIRLQEKDLEYAKRLAIEIGYYPGNLPERIFQMLEEETLGKKKADRPKELKYFIGWRAEAFRCNALAEQLSSRDEEFLISYGSPTFKGQSEQVMRTVVGDVHISYEEKRYDPTGVKPPDLTSCKRVEIRYQASMLEYFFPFAFQQSLLSPEEMKYLRSEGPLVVEDSRELKAIVRDVSKAAAVPDDDRRYIKGGVVRYRSKANVICSYDDRPSLSFSICNDDTLVIEGERLACSDGFASLKILTPQVQAIGLRMRCAANLKNLWYRFQLYYEIAATMVRPSSASKEKTYPMSSEWCDAMLQPFYHDVGPPEAPFKWDEKRYICPSAGEGKNHYAMNPDCKHDSPGDTVLLFETNGDWNQSGGPELFTFDNHDPKGGCILLNDGTVKFIRTTEELQKLRWK